jgi:hypothetical protein
MSFCLGFDPCCDRCNVCLDIPGGRSIIMTTPDVVEQTDTDPDDECPACTDYASPIELMPLSNANALLYLAYLNGVGCGPSETPVTGSFCGYYYRNECIAIPDSYAIDRFAATYRTSGGDLRMFVSAGEGKTSTNGFGCIGQALANDDFSLATGAPRFNCLDLDHDGTLTLCDGATTLCGCTLPVAYNVIFNEL